MMHAEDVEDAFSWSVERLREWIAVASVSAAGRGLDEGAEFTRRLLEEVGLAVTLLPTPGAPVVLGSRPADPGQPTVLVYGHYDVQPPEPIDAWESPPFVADVRDEAVYGRGAGDNKGQVIAHLAAIRSLLAAGRLPVGIEVLIEGEEEIGSPNVGAVVRDHRQQFAASVAVTSDAPGQADLRPLVIFGVRGLLYVQVDHQRTARDVHSGNRGGLAPSAAWELVRALSALHPEPGRVEIPGFEEAVRAPNEAEEALLAELPDDTEALLAELEVPRLASEGHPGRASMFRPTCNLAGITSGYAGAGPKTIVPHRASCKLDFRLVADQDPQDVFAALEGRLAELLPGSEVTQLAAVPPSATDPADPLCRAIVRAVERAHGGPPSLRPRLGGTTPDWIFTGILGIPSVLVPYGPPDMNHHAPNEKMTFAALRAGIRTSAEIYREVGETAGRG